MRGGGRPASVLPRHPTSIEAQYATALGDLAERVNVALMEAAQPLLVVSSETVSPGAIYAVAERISLSLPMRFLELGLDQLVEGTAQHLSVWNMRDLARVIGVRVPEFSEAIGETWRRENVSLIKSLGDQAKDNFVGMLREASQEHVRHEVLSQRIQEHLGATKARADLIARDQVLTLNAKLSEHRQKRAGIEEYDWKTMGDGSVRSNHDDLDGRRFRWDSPPIGGGTRPDEPGHPGTGINCRCLAIPVIPEFS